MVKKLSFILTTFILIFLGCDNTNSPLRKYIENATGTAKVLGYTIAGNYHVMSDGVIAISPREESARTIISLSLRNPQDYDLQLGLKGYGSSFSTVELGADKQTAVITITNQPRLTAGEIAMTMTMTANGRPLPSYEELPKMRFRYLNASLNAINITSSAGTCSFDHLFHPDNAAYTVTVPVWAVDITINPTLPANVLSSCSVYSSDSSATVTPAGNNWTIGSYGLINSIASIEVQSDSGITRIYNLTIAEAASNPGDAVVNLETNAAYSTLGNALTAAALGSEADPIRIMLLQNITAPNGGYIISKHIQLLGKDKVIAAAPAVNALFLVQAGSSLALSGMDGKTITLSGAGMAPATNLHGVTVNGKFAMNSGASIQGFIAGDKGGGVYVATDGAFTMSGGSIKGNMAGDNPIPNTYGGGVYVAAGGTFKMTGGSIEENGAGVDNITKNHMGKGGGVYIDGGNVEISGQAEIKGNFAQEGGGVCIIAGSLIMTGGIIYGSNAAPEPLGNKAEDGVSASLYVGGSGAATYDNGVPPVRILSITNNTIP